MFPEYRDLIAKLRQTDHHFRALFEQHNELDHKIVRLEHRDRRGFFASRSTTSAAAIASIKKSASHIRASLVTGCWSSKR